MGIIHGMPNDVYHAHLAVSKSGLDRLAKSPAHYLAYLKKGGKETPALRFGRLIHLAILEPEKFAADVVTAPDVNLRTKDGKAEYEEFCRLHIGCEIVKPEELDELKRIQDSAMTHPVARDLLTYAGHAEVSAFWTDEETGLECRCRPDKVLGGGVILDLKSTQDASPEGFRKSVANFRYHVQEAFYLDGYTAAGGYADTFLFVAVEKEPPYAVCVHQLDEEAREYGRTLYRRDLEKLALCRADDRWPGYPDVIVQTSLPAWAMKEALR